MKILGAFLLGLGVAGYFVARALRQLGREALDVVTHEGQGG
jgi:hypothetical protein